MPGTPPQQTVRQDDAFSIAVTRDATGVRVTLFGEFGLAAEERWRGTLAEVGDDWSQMMIDLSALEFMDSTGLRLVISLGDQCEAAERSFSLRLGNGAAGRLFDLSGLRHKFAEAPEKLR